jgi:O-methyltransferase involved in polyketide biosynthesis
LIQPIAELTQVGLGYMRQVGEPWIAGFTPDELAEELKTLGFALQENLTPVDIQARYFASRSDGYHAYEHVHFAQAVLRGTLGNAR